MSLIEAKELLSKSLKDMTEEEKQKLQQAVQVVANFWGKLNG